MADFVSRFTELSARHPGNDTDLGAALGVTKQTISAWRTGVRSPKRTHIVKLAEYFGVGIPWLMGITDDEQAGTQPDASAAPASPEEMELVGIYRELNATGQAALMGTARGLAANPDMKKGGASSTATA